jgi:hypothetical protein
MFENNRRNRFIATTAACAIGLSALTSCSKPKKVELTGCTTTWMGSDTPGVRDTILKAMNEDSVKETGKSLTDYGAYSGASNAATAIENSFIKSFAKQGKVISTDMYDVAQTKPFNGSVLQYCIDTNGKITKGNEDCLIIGPDYISKNSKNQLLALEPQCGDITANSSK